MKTRPGAPQRPPQWVAAMVTHLVPRSRRVHGVGDPTEDYKSFPQYLKTTALDIVYANMSSLRRYIHASPFLKPKPLGLAITMFGFAGGLFKGSEVAETALSRGLDFSIGFVIACSAYYWMIMPPLQSGVVSRTAIPLMFILLCQVSLVLVSVWRALPGLRKGTQTVWGAGFFAWLDLMARTRLLLLSREIWKV